MENYFSGIVSGAHVNIITLVNTPINNNFESDYFDLFFF